MSAGRPRLQVGDKQVIRLDMLELRVTGGNVANQVFHGIGEIEHFLLDHLFANALVSFPAVNLLVCLARRANSTLEELDKYEEQTSLALSGPLANCALNALDGKLAILIGNFQVTHSFHLGHAHTQL
jgi:hypothetical protein